MFPFLRLSAVMASIVVASTAFGFGLGSAISAGEHHASVRSLDGTYSYSSAKETHSVVKSRSISGLRDVAFNYAMLEKGNIPAVNMIGPRPGMEHVDLGTSCPLASSCLVAMN
jgi:hypothetical protein